MCTHVALHKPFDRRRYHGLTLIEILVVLALTAIMASLAVPTWRALQVQTAIRITLNEYVASLHHARLQAVKLNAPVTVCPSQDGVGCTLSGLEEGWIVVLGNHSTPSPAILQDVLPKHPGLVQTRYGQTARYVTYLPNGMAMGGSMRNISLCPPEAEHARYSRSIVLNQTARVRIASPGNCS